jgi:predicted nucleotidyltransferase
VGNQLTMSGDPNGADILDPLSSIVPWLDHETMSLVRDITNIVACSYPEVRAIILYGSVARHEARPLTDAEPSDVDLLLLVNVDDDARRIPYELRHSINTSTGLALDRHLHAPREVQTLLVASSLVDWDPTFIENIARDGILLWARGPLPEALAPIASRHLGDAVPRKS